MCPTSGLHFGGTSVGGMLFVDVDVSSRLSVGGEVSLGSELKGGQQQRVLAGRNEHAQEPTPRLEYFRA